LEIGGRVGRLGSGFFKKVIPFPFLKEGQKLGWIGGFNLEFGQGISLIGRKEGFLKLLIGGNLVEHNGLVPKREG